MKHRRPAKRRPSSLLGNGHAISFFVFLARSGFVAAEDAEFAGGGAHFG